MAKVGTSAIESRKLGYLLDSDIIVPHKDEVLFTAINEAKALAASGWRAPVKRLFPVAGRSGIATIQAQLVNMRDGGFISAYDFKIARMIAEVVCGGEVDGGTLVTEEYLLALERKAFCHLIGQPKTHERILGMLDTGKPVATNAAKREITMKQVQEAYIVAATRTPIGRSGRGYFKNTRPDDLLLAAVRGAMAQVPTLDPPGD